ncbi:unnamed protein product, partial [Prorocentrum cordatum]
MLHCILPEFAALRANELCNTRQDVTAFAMTAGASASGSLLRPGLGLGLGLGLAASAAASASASGSLLPPGPRLALQVKRGTKEAASFKATVLAPLGAPAHGMPAQRRRFAHRRTAAEVDRCKRGERSDIKVSDWGKFGYADREQVLSQPIQYDEQTVPIPRVKSSEVTPESFFEQFSSRCQPVIVEGAVAQWAAMRRWDPSELEKRFRHVLFK